MIHHVNMSYKNSIGFLTLLALTLSLGAIPSFKTSNFTYAQLSIAKFKRGHIVTTSIICRAHKKKEFIRNYVISFRRAFHFFRGQKKLH
jgi:hypothetical protein